MPKPHKQQVPNHEKIEGPMSWSQPTEDDIIQDDPMLPKKSLFRVGEVANYLGYSESTIRLWIDHGKLKAEKHNREFRITREVILAFRKQSQFRPLEEGIKV